MATTAMPLRNGSTIVVVGAWNAAIFSAGWVSGGRLTDSNEIGFELNTENLTIPARLVFDGMRLQVTAQRLLISPVELDDDSLGRIERAAERILAELPHTPVRAVGVNFRYTVEAAEGALLEAFELKDSIRLADAEAIVEVRETKRQLRYRDLPLNFGIELKPDGNAIVDFNFHQTVTNAADASEFLKRGVLSLRDASKALLRDAYGLDVEGG